MSFFNRKEEVLELQLTPYGRYLLSKGELRPVYYSFFDDDILYDRQYATASLKENQSEIVTRIKETPRSHIQTAFRERSADIQAGGDKRTQNFFERNYSLSSELGTSDYYSNFAPAWDIDFLKGQLTGSTQYYTGSGPIYNIPQIKLSSSHYEPIVGNLPPTGKGPALLYEEDLRTVMKFSDDTYLEIRKDFILLELEERNAISQKENFDIELFEVTENTEGLTTTETLVPLKLASFRGDSLDNSFVLYYFDIDVDYEIDEARLCKYKGVDSTKGLYLRNIFDCELETEFGQTESVDQYATNIIEDDIEVCD